MPLGCCETFCLIPCYDSPLGARSRSVGNPSRIFGEQSPQDAFDLVNVALAAISFEGNISQFSLWANEALVHGLDHFLELTADRIGRAPASKLVAGDAALQPD